MGHHFGFKGRRRSQASSRFVERRADIWDVFADDAIVPVVDMRDAGVPGDSGPVVDVSGTARLVWARAANLEHSDTNASRR